MKKFREFHKQKMTEGWFSWGKKPASDPLDADIHKDQSGSTTGIKTNAERSAIDRDIASTTQRFDQNSLYRALTDFRTRHGNQYTPQEISFYSQDASLNALWDKKYKMIYSTAKGQSSTKQFILDRAFQEMGIPAPKPPLAIPVPQPQSEPAPPELKAISQYARERLASDKNLNADELKKEILKKYPGLVQKYGKWVYAQIGRIVNMATRPSIVKPEPIETEPEPDRNILKFPGPRSQRMPDMQ